MGTRPPSRQCHPRIDALNVRSLLRSLLDLPARSAWARRRGSIAKHGEADEPVVSFGGVLDQGGLIHGGAVKLLHLRDAFRCDERTFNILYLVSSSQPPFAEDLARICRERKIAFVWNQNGVGYPGWAGRDAERHNAPMRRLRAQADFVVYQSEFCRSSAGLFLGLSQTPAGILLNPVDLEKFRPPSEPRPAKPLRLLALGTHNYPDRVLSTLQAVKRLRDGGIEATLTVAGRLQWRGGGDEIRRAIDGLRAAGFISLRPAFSQDEAAELYRAHHILLHPKYLDPCPTVVIEALASGLPVVGSASGGLPEMVPPSCGELIPVPLAWDRMITPTGAQLAEAVSRLLPSLAAHSRSARAWAESQFSAVAWVARHHEIFTRLLR